MMYVDLKQFLIQYKVLVLTQMNHTREREVNQHIPSRFCIYSKFAYGEVENPLRLYIDEDCVEKFCDHIREEAKRLYHMFPEKAYGSPN